MFDKYVAKPWHFLFSILLFSIAVVLNTFENATLATISIAFYVCSFGSYLIILASGTIPYYTEYWREVSRFSDLMLKNRNPELWNALGFSPPPLSTTKVNMITDHGNGFEYVEIMELPVSDEVMQIISKGVVEGRMFSEGEWVGNSKVTSSAKFRKLQKYLLERNCIRLNNANNSRMGYSLTRKGTVLFEDYANRSIATTPLSRLALPPKT